MPLQQLVCRIEERRKTQTSSNRISFSEDFELKPKKIHFDGPMVEGVKNVQFEKVKLKNFTISRTGSDNCVQLNDDSICVIDNIAYSKDNSELVIIGRKFMVRENVFRKPYESSIVGIFKVSNLEGERQVWYLKEIKHKALRIPFENSDHFRVALLLHSSK